MAFCDKCGKHLSEGETVCRECGSVAGGVNFNRAFDNFMNTEDSTGEFSADDIKSNYGVAAVSYLPILFIIPLAMAPDSKFARFHANQGIVLFIFEIVFGLIFGTVKFILGVIPWIGGLLAWIVGAVFGFLIIAFVVAGIVNAANGRAKKLPVIGGMKILS
ncbi:MAG: hypothetical protein LBI38_00690 [Oscillospiraceae bacterium]|jgi:uncharacterized membrane protein|nr:hypothetical protein [Oscillospiraceae bacterium]